MSDTQARIDGDAAVASGGGLTQADAGAGTLILVPGGEDDLAWAVYTLPDCDLDRPVELEIGAQIIVPGGEDDLLYWVLYSDYSANRWKMAQGPNADGSFSGPANVTLNSAQRRERVVSAKGAADPTFSYAIVTQGNAANSTGKPFDQQPRVVVESGDTTLRGVVDAAYRKTKPLMARVSGISSNAATGEVSVSFDPNSLDGTDLVFVQRRIPGGNWQELGGAEASLGVYNDPADNSAGEPPQLGETYQYRAVAAALDDTLELRAYPTLPQSFTLPETLTPQAVILADLTAGPAPLSVSFDASQSVSPTGTITDYEWDFNGNGLYNQAGTEAAARGNPTPAPVSFTDVGAYTVRLRVTDGSGESGAASLIVTVRGWLIQTIDSAGLVGEYTSLAVIGGRPAIAYYDRTNGDLKYAYSTSPDGNGGWSSITVDSAGDVGLYASLADINGKPAIAYWDSANFDLKYAWSTSATGASGWNSLAVDTADAGEHTSLALINGCPAISYQTLAGASPRLWYAWSSNSDGSSGWNKVQVEVSNSFGFYSSLELVNGFPAIVHTGANLPSGSSIIYSRSSQADGSGNWSTAIIRPAGGGLGFNCPSLKVINGRPAVFFSRTAGNSYPYLFYNKSASIDGSAGWSETTLQDNVLSDDPAYCSLANLAGKPAASFYRGDTTAGLGFVRSSVANPLSAADWTRSDVEDGNVGQYCSLVETATFRPAVSYFNADNSDLKYAILFE